MLTNVFLFNKTTGFVGIGTTTPSTLLDVRLGTVAASNFSGIGASVTNLNATSMATGTIPSALLPATGVTPATYGSASAVSQLTVDARGRVTNATNTTIALAGSAITSGAIPAAVLPPSGVTPATYGSASAVAQVTVDATGRVTSAANTTIALAGSAITSGTIPAAVLPPSGVTPATYGSASTIPQISVDAYGRITTASSVAIPPTAPYIPNMLIYTSPGTWTIPPGTTRFRVTAVGGGGTGGAPPSPNEAGGGGGAFIWVVNYVNGQNTVSYTVGLGGIQPGNPSRNGQNTTVTYNGVTATAGGGKDGSNGNFGIGGTATGGTINMPGTQAGANINMPGIGGASYLSTITNNYSRQADVSPGNGNPWGGGGAKPTATGAPGIVIIEY